MVWTVNLPERMREFAAWGADAIISDETELLSCSTGTVASLPLLTEFTSFTLN